MKQVFLSFAMCAFLFSACKNNSSQADKMDEAADKMEEATQDLEVAAKRTADSTKIASETADEKAVRELKLARESFKNRVAQLHEAIKTATGEEKAKLENELELLEAKGKGAGYDK